MKKNNLFIITGLFFIALGCFANNKESFIKNNQEDKRTHEVVTYQDIIKNYYNLEIGNTNNPSKTYPEFYEEIYSEDSDRNILKHTLKLAEENDNLSVVESTFDESGVVIETQSSSSSASNNGGNCIDVSYKESDFRAITIATNLNETNKTFNVVHRVVEWSEEGV